MLLFAVMAAGDPSEHVSELLCCPVWPDSPAPISVSVGAWYADQSQLSLMEVEVVVMTSACLLQPLLFQQILATFGCVCVCVVGGSNSAMDS